MSATKVKVYKNPARNKPVVHKPYVPQYQVMGVEPTGGHSERKIPMVPGSTSPRLSPGSQDNPRAQRPHVRQQPYAEAIPSPVGRGRGPLPNVGNNMEQTWSGVDGELVDDISEKLNPNHKMVDNNEFVSANALGLVEEEYVEEDGEEAEYTEIGGEAINQLRESTSNIEKTFLTENVLQDALHEEYLSKVIKQLDEGEYCLLVEGTAICSGPEDYIEEQTRLLVFGEHEMYSGNPVSVDDIIVIKRTKIKVGVFLE